MGGTGATWCRSCFDTINQQSILNRKELVAHEVGPLLAVRVLASGPRAIGGRFAFMGSEKLSSTAGSSDRARRRA